MLTFVAEICLHRDELIIIYMIDPVFRSPSITTMRDIDPKLPAARRSLDGYPLSDGDWPSNDRYVLTRTQSQQRGCGRHTEVDYLIDCLYLFYCPFFLVMACRRLFPQRATLN